MAGQRAGQALPELLESFHQVSLEYIMRRFDTIQVQHDRLQKDLLSKIQELRDHVRTLEWKLHSDNNAHDEGGAAPLGQEPFQFRLEALEGKVRAISEGSVRSVQANAEDENCQQIVQTDRGRSIALEDFDARLEQYAIRESVWDAGLFLGLNIAGIGGSFVTGLLLVVNITVQCTFCVICWLAFYDANFDKDTVFGLKVWRVNSAHDVGYTNDIWPMSLASRVCGDDASLPLSAKQAADISQLQKFEPEGYYFVGQLMCLSCLVCFWTILLSETTRALDFARALLQAERGLTRWNSIVSGLILESFEFQSISPKRAFFLITITSLRWVVIVNLGSIGTVWMVHTTSVGELLLNAIALELVLSVDELLFDGLAPMRIKVLVQNCSPLPTGYARRLLGVNVFTGLGLFALLVALPSVYFSLMSETHKWVERAMADLCGGVTNFVYSEDTFGIVYIHDGLPMPGDVGFTEQDFDLTDTRIMALEEVQKGIPRQEWQYAIYEPDLSELRSRRTQKPYGIMERINRDCVDLLYDAALLPGQSGIALRAAMRRAANNMSIHDCASVEPYCYYYHNSGPLKTASMLARTLCPRTCGCTSLTSGTLVIGGNTNFLGCPSACDRYRGWDFAVQLVDTCEDMEGTSSTSWSVWMQEAAHVVGESDETIHMLRQDGCSANVFKTSTRDDLCLGAGIWQMMKPLLYVCPEACGCCDEGDKGRNWNRDPRCPPACQQCNNTSL